MSVALEDLLKMTPEEIPAHNEKPTSEQLRNKSQTYFEDVYEGMELPKYIYSPTPTHLFRWSAAIENFHRIHYDLDFGLNHDKNPSILVHGSWKQSVVPQYLKDWTLPGGWPWKASIQHRAMLVPGDIIILWGKVTNKEEKGGMGLVGLGPGNDHPGRHRKHAGNGYRGPSAKGWPGNPLSLCAASRLDARLAAPAETVRQRPAKR